MKYLKKFQTNTDYQAYKTGGNYITPNVSIISEGDTIIFEPFAGIVSLITFTVNGAEFQAEEGMTFYDWAMSKYFDSSCSLRLVNFETDNLRDDIII